MSFGWRNIKGEIVSVLIPHLNTNIVVGGTVIGTSYKKGRIIKFNCPDCGKEETITLQSRQDITGTPILCGHCKTAHLLVNTVEGVVDVSETNSDIPPGATKIRLEITHVYEGFVFEGASVPQAMEEVRKHFKRKPIDTATASLDHYDMEYKETRAVESVI